MSYRSVKRVLGETRLELKCLVLFAVCLFTLIGGSFWWYGSRTENMVVDNTRAQCRNLVDAVILEHHWAEIDQTSHKKGGGIVAYWAESLHTHNYRFRFISRPEPWQAVLT